MGNNLKSYSGADLLMLGILTVAAYGSYGKLGLLITPIFCTASVFLRSRLIHATLFGPNGPLRERNVGEITFLFFVGATLAFSACLNIQGVGGPVTLLLLLLWLINKFLRSLWRNENGIFPYDPRVTYQFFFIPFMFVGTLVYLFLAVASCRIQNYDWWLFVFTMFTTALVLSVEKTLLYFLRKNEFTIFPRGFFTTLAEIQLPPDTSCTGPT